MNNIRKYFKPMNLIGLGVLLAVLAIFFDGRIAILGILLVVLGVIRMGISDEPSVLQFYGVLIAFVVAFGLIMTVTLILVGGEYAGGGELVAFALFILPGALFALARFISSALKRAKKQNFLKG